MFKQLFFILIGSIITFSYAEEKNSLYKENMLVDKIIQNQDFCIKEINQDRIYLIEDSIYPTQNGLFLILNDENESIRISNLYSDEYGCFIKCGLLKQKSTSSDNVKILNNCPGCKKRYFITCNNPDCPLKKRDS